MAIMPAVLNGHLNTHTNEAGWLSAFGHEFDINHAQEWRAANALLSVYQISPQANVREAFGFEQELLLAYSKFDKLQPRAIQALDEFLINGIAPRADRRIVLLVSEANNPADWVKNYLADNREQRLIVTFAAADLYINADDTWYVRNELMRQLYSRDLFGNLLALDTDAGFFGRSIDIQAIRELVLTGGIGGLFGLRKTGKTSLLNKLRRELEKEEGVVAHRLNCETVVVRTLRHHEFLDALSKLMEGANVRSGGLAAAARRFEAVSAQATAGGRRVVFLLDEIEKVSPFALQDKHWRTDFVDVWQILRDMQDTNRRLSFIMAGVSPAVTETSEFAGVANPLFGIVTVRYLTGLTLDEVQQMLRTLGGPTGVRFDEAAVRYIRHRYGGNTYLTRMACKLMCEAHPTGRPLNVTLSLLTREEAGRDGSLAAYCNQVLSDLKKFYADEYQLLELLASRQLVDFRNRSRGGSAVTHLRGYGLLEDSANGPAVGIPVIGRLLSDQTADRWLPEPADRGTWVRDRVGTLMAEIRAFERRLHTSGRPPLFGTPSFPHPEQLDRLVVVTDRESFQGFINTLNRCFVESVEVQCKRYGGRPNFWSLKLEFLHLFPVLDRIKVYRHNEDHLVLDPPAEAKYMAYIADDLRGQSPAAVPDLYFTLQFRVLELLLIAVWDESDQLV